MKHSAFSLLRLTRGLASLASGVLLLALLIVSDVAISPQKVSAAEDLYPDNTLHIQHIVIIVKENRTFDNYFGTFPKANGATTYKDPKGVIHPLNHTPDSTLSGIGHRWQHARLAWDNGKMDKFSLIPGAIQNSVDVADSQLYQSDIPNYWTYAKTFALADNFFSVIMGPTFPNHLFLIAATGANVNDNPSVSDPTLLNRWGCDAPPGTTVRQLQPDGTTTYTYPCFNIQTLGGLLTQNNRSWKYYAPPQDQPGYQFSIYNAISSIRNTIQWNLHVTDQANFEADVAAGNLPAVTWLVPDLDDSEHAPHSSCVGENWTVQKINAIMSSPLWSSTAIILTWDDFGGFYDHVPPPQGPNPLIQFGFRVPALIISPYSRHGFIDHNLYSFASILKFAEKNYGLPSLTQLDRSAINLNNSLNFQQKPLPPLILQPRACPPPPPGIDYTEDDPVD